MDGTRLIDEATRAKLRMTPEEANAVVEMWAVQSRLAYDPTSLTSPIPSGLVLPHQEVRFYLNEVRGLSNRKLRPARSIGADVRLAIIAASVLLIAALGFAFALGWGRRAHYPVYPSGPMIGVGPTTQVNGLRRTRYLNADNRFWLSERSSLPVRFVFANDQYVFEPVRTAIPADLDSLKAALKTVVGGPLAASSRLSNRAISPAEVSQVLARSPVDPSASPTPPELAQEEIVEWQTVKVAYGGRITEAVVPYARYSDKTLRDLVQKEQERIIEGLADSGMALAGPSTPTEFTSDVPTPLPGQAPRAQRPGIR